MTNHLLLFTIGPVQSFIEQARKTQDLYAGSQLLSELVKTVMDELKTTYPNVEFIFPKPQEGKNISYPNRFIASIPEAKEDNLKTIGNDLKEKVIKTFKNKFYVDTAKETRITIEQKDCYCKQLDGFLDINWVILPYEKEKYKETYKEIEKTLGAIKNVRAFNQLDELGRKCSLCGERNVLFYKECSECKKGNKEKHECTYNKVKLKPNWKNFDDNNFEDQEIKTKIHHYNNSLVDVPGTKVQSGEGLCAVCFTKRFYPNAESFPSTAGIALIDTLKKLDSELLNQYKDLFKAYTFDEQLYFDENLIDAYFKKNNLEGLIDKLPDIKKKNEEIKKASKQRDLKLNNYYAIIAIDGDNMGKWLSGEFLQDASNLESFHKKLSKELGIYAGNVKTYIKEDDGSGKLVYSGGDDVLAFVNLNHLTKILTNLKQDFPKFEDIEVEGKKVVKENQKSSASCGVAIAHYKIPLGETLKRARKMEKAAKENGGRNAFGLAVLKHSGEIEESVFKWNYNGYDEEQSDVAISSIKLLEDLVDHLKKEEFSNTFIKSLNLEFRKLMDDDYKIKDEGMIKTEIGRLVGRSCMLSKKADESDSAFKDRKKETIKDLSDKLYQLYLNSKNFQNFLSFLNIADFLHRKVNK